MRVDAVERCLTRLTEAAIRIGDERMGRIAPETAMHQVREMGKMLRHEYDVIDPAVTWAMITQALPLLREACEQALADDGATTR